MEKLKIKEYAINSRIYLIDKIKIKLNLYYISEKITAKQNGDIYDLFNEINEKILSLTIDEYRKRELLIKRINEIGLDRVIEEAAYTWFNRLIAIRYMEIHDYLPLGKNNESLGIRVLSSNDNTPNPEIMKFSNLINGQLDINFNQDYYLNLKNDNEKFKYILQLVCNKLKNVFPDVFGGNTDYIDLLIPENMLSETGFITRMLEQLNEDDFEQVEIIGWLYQYYNQTEKDRVINAKKMYKIFEIPYATQLFTPDWIVKYMVENSLGRFWIEHSNFDDKEIINKWNYYINIELNKKKTINPETIKFIDPCCGSGHVLVYAFEILYQIYESVGYNKKDIAELILKNNLYGLDIDDRAGQLSILSVLLKAREYDVNIFSKQIVSNLNIKSFYNVNEEELVYIDFLPENIKQQCNCLFDNYKNSKEIGSFIEAKDEDYSLLLDYMNSHNSLETIFLRNTVNNFIQINDILNIKYDVVVTNPPYMNYTLMPENLKKFVKSNFSLYSSDMFETSVIRFLKLLNEDRYFGCITPYAWMFLKSYKDLRKEIINHYDITSLVQLEYNSFEACALPICTYVLKTEKSNDYGTYIRLTDYAGVELQEPKYLEAINNLDSSNDVYKTKIDNYKNIELWPIAYWVSDKEFEMTKKLSKIGDFFQVKGGMTTGNNELFMRRWYEVDFSKIGIGYLKEEAIVSDKKWFPYNKGGLYRKWYGNLEFIVDWEKDGSNIKNYKLNQRQNDPKYNTAIAALDSMFKIQYSWSLLSGCNLSVRYYPTGCLFDVSGSSVVLEENDYYLLGYLNSNLVNHQLNYLNPTLNTQPGNIKSLIYKNGDSNYLEEINNLVQSNINISKEDWDIDETSWDFKRNLLINNKKIKDAVDKIKIDCQKRFNLLKSNEKRLNEIYNDIFNLSDIISSEVDDKNISLLIPTDNYLIKDLISYAVGCMFGRYSLDKDGLCCTSKNIDNKIYDSFHPDEDNIIPINDSNEIYFEDDIVTRFKKFIKKAFDEKEFDNNMNYIADSLGRKGTESYDDTLRRYFINDFYNDHCKKYQKKPIYWMVDSGKKNGFKALIYIHRYDKQLLSKVRVEYLHKTQDSYNRIKSEATYNINNGINIKENQEKIKTVSLKIDECNDFDEKLGHLANQMIDIDLDDGVKVNYEKFESILSKIK